jgi:uncharacterized protein YecE (DUF72 family)
MATLFAGTSGFAYPAWKPAFYPEDLPSARFLQYYATRLTCVEINYTFRRTPARKTLESWIAATPPGFTFAMKAHQRVTHAHRLKEGAREPLEFFLSSLAPLRDAGRLGPVLLQLPPNLRLDRDRLARFLEWLPRDTRFAFEFRDASWFTEEVYDLLRAHDASLCVADAEQLAVPDVPTASFAYFRLRRPPYDELALRRLRRRSEALLGEGRDVFLLFKHEEDAGGALEAERILAA